MKKTNILKKALSLFLALTMLISVMPIAFAEEFNEQTNVPSEGYIIKFYNEDGTDSGFKIDATNSTSAPRLSTALEDAYVFAENGAMFGIEGRPSLVVEIYEDIVDGEKAEIKYDMTINGNGHTLTYTGNDRAIDVPNTATEVNLTVNDLTVDCTASYCQRGINYNTTGVFILDSVTVKGENLSYAVNLPGMSIGADVSIADSDLSGCIALNIWGANSNITVTDSVLTSVDENTVEGYAAIALNDDGTTSAAGTTLIVNGGVINALNENGEFSKAVRNASIGTVSISESTVVNGIIDTQKIVATVRYGDAVEFYSYGTLMGAVNKAMADVAAGINARVELISDVEVTEDLTISGIEIAAGDYTITNKANLIINGGSAITGTPETAEAYSVIINKGTLTVDGDDTTISVDHAIAGSTSYAVNAITNVGTLIINGGTIKNTSSSTNQIGYAIDNNSGTANAFVTINGGEIKASGSYYYDGIRQFANSTVNENTVTVAGGKVGSIWLQNPSDGVDSRNTKDVKGCVAVTGGNIGGIYLEPSASFDAAITGGTIGGLSYFETDSENLGRNLEGFVSGGTFTSNPGDAFAAEGFKFKANAEGGYDVETAGLSGAGTQADPYIIFDLEDLKWFRDDVNGGNTYAKQYVQLADNIDLGSEEWTSIGNGSRDGSSYTGNAFKGVFYGGDKTILNLTITSGESSSAIGLFGVVDGGTVKNLKLSNVNINASSNKNAGAAIGLMVGGATADSITVGGLISAADGVGGVVGRMTIQGTVSNCENNANVSGAAAGGIVGKAYYTGIGVEMDITNCINSGTITGTSEGAVGGIVGFSTTNVFACTNNGTIKSTVGGANLGGIAGWQQMYGEISGNTNNGFVTSEYKVTTAGGIVGWANYQYATDGTASEYPRYEVISVTENTNNASIIAANSTLGSGGIVGGAYNAISVTGNINYAEKITGSAFAAGILGNYQNNDANGYKGDARILTVTNNTTYTKIENIIANCVNVVCYDNVFYSESDYTTNNTVITESPVAQIGDVKYTTLAEAVDAAVSGDTITIIADVELTSPVVISGKNLTLDLSDYTVYDKSTRVLTSSDDIWGLIALESEAKLTVCGDGTIECNYTNSGSGWTGMAFCIDVDATSELTVNGGNFVNGNGGIQTHGKVNVNGGTFVSHNGGTCIMTVGSTANVTVNDGIFKDSVEENDVYTGSGAVWSGFGATVTINGGTYDFAADPEHGNIVWTLFPAQNAISGLSGQNANMTVTGGTFINFNPATDVVVDYSLSAGFTFGSVVADGYEINENADGTYSVVEKTTEKFNVGMNMTLGGSLSVNFYVPAANCAEDIYAKVVKKYSDGRADAVVKIPYSQWQAYGNSYKRFSYSGVAAKEMSDEFEVTVYNGEGIEISNTIRRSIRGYAMDVLNEATTKLESKILMVDMLNYGAAAQTKFGYGTSDLANALLEDEQRALATESTPFGDVTIEHPVASSLLLESKIALNLYFKDVKDTMRAIVEFTDSYGNEKTINVAYREFGTNGTYKFIIVDELAVADYKSIITCTIYDGDTVFAIGQQSIEQYLKQAQAQTSNPLYDSIMKFATSAYNYMHQD